MKTAPESKNMQGEGDYQANQRYTESAQKFAKSGKVAEAAKNASPGTPAEQAELKRAEQAGASHSKGEDPASPRAPARKP